MTYGTSIGDPADSPSPAALKRAQWETWRDRLYRGYAVAVGVCLVGAFVESFRNLITYFEHNGYGTGYAVIAPTMIDIFTIGGELLVLIAVMEHWDWKPKAAGWLAVVLGLAASLAGNVGRDGWTVPGPHGTHRFIPVEHVVAFAAPPLALFGLLALGLMIVKRAWKVGAYERLEEHALAALHHFPAALDLEAEVPSVAAIKKTARIAQPKAQLVRDYLVGLREDLAVYAEARDAA